jgi:predicted O-linked N-acetylglucosamine transferase (SPINDLY family)
MQRRVAKAFDRFIDVRSSRDREIAALSRQLGIDIAIDLKGYTTDARPGIFAERCAPVQVSYLGYPGTLGAPFIDYLIADRQIVPDGRRRDYSEKLAYLPICYQPNDPSRRIAETTDARSDHALPANGFVFCCFNASYKILPDMFDVWMRILGAVEGSVLWLLNENSTTMANLRGEAERRGVSGERLVFAPRIAGTAHLARHRHADLFLDTFPCNAHTTASDALWAGLPVLTRCGESFASRVAASLLNAVQLNELVTATGEDYARQAIELATHGDKLSTLKTRLAAQRDTAPLFDSTRYARDIESTYLAMIERRQAGLSPAHLYPGARR